MAVCGSNVTLEEWLDNCLPDPKQYPVNKLLPLALLYAGIFIVGVVGNLLTIYVIATHRFMWSTANFLLLNLAVTDLLILTTGLPMEVYQQWHMYPFPDGMIGNFLCKGKAWSMECSAYASVLTICAFTFERYYATSRGGVTDLTKRRLSITICAIWLLASLCALPMALQFGVIYYIRPGGTNVVVKQLATCNAYPDKEATLQVLLDGSFFIFFVFPICFVLITYTLIGRTVKQSVKLRDSADEASCVTRECVSCDVAKKSSKQHRYESSRNSVVVKIQVTVAAMFFISWSPFHFQRLLYTYVESLRPSPIMDFLYLSAGITYYLGAVVNPFLYNFMSARFRKAVRRTRRRLTGGISTRRRGPRLRIARQDPERCLLPDCALPVNICRTPLLLTVPESRIYLDHSVVSEQLKEKVAEVTDQRKFNSF